MASRRVLCIFKSFRLVIAIQNPANKENSISPYETYFIVVAIVVCKITYYSTPYSIKLQETRRSRNKLQQVF